MKKEKIITIITLLASIATIIGVVFNFINTPDNKTVEKVTLKDVSGNKIIGNNNTSDITVNSGGQVAGGDIINNNDNTNVEKEASIQFQDIDYKYLSPNLEDHDLWMIGEEKRRKPLPCASSLKLLVTNENSKNDIQLTKLKLVALNIKQLNIPRLKCEIVVSDDRKEIGLIVRNIGWGDAHCVKVNLMNDSSIYTESKYQLKDLFKEMVLVDIPILKMNEEIYTTLFTSKQIKQRNIHSVSIFPNFEMNCEEFTDSKIDSPIDGIGVYVEKEHEPHFFLDGGLGDSEYIYGMLIDATKNKDIYESNISECIPAGNLLNMPIIFFPNRSCELDFYFEVEVISSFRKYTIKTEMLHKEFDIVPNVDGYVDGAKLDPSEYENNEDSEELISYPFRKADKTKASDKNLEK